MKDLKNVKIGCIGSGTMGGALMSAMAKKIGAKNISVTDVDFSKAKAFAEKHGMSALDSNVKVAESSDVIFLAVKPAYVTSVLKEISGQIDENKVVVSMAAGVKLDTLEECFSYSAKFHIIRIMPNLPATVGEAMIALSPSKNVSDEETALVKELLDSAGKAEIVPEKLMDGVTAVSGSGPAYGFLFIEALADAAVRFGMPRAQAYVYAAQTLKGAAAMALEDGRSISELKDAVCSPAGTTIEGVIALEKNGFRNAVIEAATAAFNKSVELGKK
ncbi:MAG: pyrroline-5-carboxylate reductase [Treponema sp.]|nr:pyrroline-5-carboxylate reductase [Treponema sp.]